MSSMNVITITINDPTKPTKKNTTKSLAANCKIYSMPPAIVGLSHKEFVRTARLPRLP